MHQGCDACKRDGGDNRMQKNGENVAHVLDGIELKKLKNSIGLWNSPTTGDIVQRKEIFFRQIFHFFENASRFLQRSFF